MKVKRVCKLGLLGTFLLLPLVVALGGPKGTRPSADSHELQHASLPVTIYNGYLVVALGQIGGQKVNFVVDTGTAPSILNARVAKKMGLEVKAGTLVAAGRSLDSGQAILPELEFGPIHLTNWPVNVMDLSSLESSLGIRVAGLIGMDVLENASFRLDYVKNELQFGVVDEAGIPVRYDVASRLGLADATLQGRPVRLIVDTGSDLVVVYGEAWEAMESAAKQISTMQTGTSVGDHVPVRQIGKPEMELGGFQFKGSKTYYVPTGVAKGYDGFFGVRALKLRGIAFNHETRTMFLLK